VKVRPLAADEQTLLRDLRLRALGESPDAFEETVADALSRPDSYWAELTKSVTAPGRHAMFLAEDTEGPSGFVFGLLDSKRPDVGHLGGMWVDPRARSRGAGRALANAVISWARGRGLLRLELWVTEGNEGAIRLYERCGFTVTGHRRPLPSNVSLQIVEMTLLLGRISSSSREPTEATMSNPVFAWIVIGIGVLLLLISVLADPLGLGRHPGFGWIQGLGVVIGALVILAGLYLRRRKASP
jgi:GNAT superfamily N-acetyltransferase